jgi:hypothetical protein
VNTIINDGPAARPEWAKVPITFTEEDFRLKSAIHNDAMVIEVNIAGWVIGKVLVDNKTAGQAPGEDSIPEEEGEAKDPQDSRTTTQKLRGAVRAGGAASYVLRRDGRI